MKWNWCEMCRFDNQCENQDRNIECACYAREQTLRAEQYGNLIDIQQKKISQFKSLLKEANNWLKAFYAYEQSDFVREQVKQCLTKINQALGEE